jgi:hypothetical protein
VARLQANLLLLKNKIMETGKVVELANSRKRQAADAYCLSVCVSLHSAVTVCVV